MNIKNYMIVHHHMRSKYKYDIYNVQCFTIIIVKNLKRGLNRSFNCKIDVEIIFQWDVILRPRVLGADLRHFLWGKSFLQPPSLECAGIGKKRWGGIFSPHSDPPMSSTLLWIYCKNENLLELFLGAEHLHNSLCNFVTPRLRRF